MDKHTQKQDGQSLVLILVVLVVGAIIAFAIAARTIQDIRRTGEERISNQAGTQVETMLDVTTSEAVWSTIWVNGAIDPNACIHNEIDPCCFTAEDLGLDSECDHDDDYYGNLICVRLEANVIDRYIEKDDVFEINLSGAEVSDSFTIGWRADTPSAAKMIIKVYQDDGGAVVLGSSSAYRKDDGSGWGIPDPAEVTYEKDLDLFVRIRAIGSGITIWTDGEIPPQDLSVLATCHIGGIYREFVRSVPLYSYLPACFDYVLFDGSTMVENFDSF